MDRLQKQGNSDGVPSTGDDVGTSIDRVEKIVESQRRESEDHIREWHLDDLLSFEPSFEWAVDGSSTKRKGLKEEPTSARLASHRAQSTTTRTSNKANFALIILNQVIDVQVEIFLNLFIHAQLVVCADGGANHLSNFNHLTGHELIPSVVAGDFDSLTGSVRAEFEKEGTVFRKDIDQNTTDFDKAIHIIKEYESQDNVDLGILALGGLGGRVDQSFSSIHQLYKCSPTSHLYLLSRKSLTCLLPAGRNRIHASKTTFGPTCGIVPTSGPTTITLQGFKWDLEDFVTEFGGFVSTSNEIAEDSAIVISDKPVLWTIEIQEVEEEPVMGRRTESIRIQQKIDLTDLR